MVKKFPSMSAASFKARSDQHAELKEMIYESVNLKGVAYN